VKKEKREGKGEWRDFDSLTIHVRRGKLGNYDWFTTGATSYVCNDFRK